MPGAITSHPSSRGLRVEPTLGQVMRRPRWILALLLALAVAAGFAWLGQWQLSNAVRLESGSSVASEEPRALDALSDPASPVTSESAGMVATASGSFDARGFRVVEQRVHRGDEGAWVVGGLRIHTPMEARLAVAIGWAPSAAEAAAAIPRLSEPDPGAVGLDLRVTGRYLPADGARLPAVDDDPQRILSVTPAQLANLWDEPGVPVYAGYLLLHPDDSDSPVDAGRLASAGLTPIDSEPPLPEETVNWLNLFYAVEWCVFAGFAVFFWYRLARDAWERIHELAELRDAERAGGGAGARPGAPPDPAPGAHA